MSALVLLERFIDARIEAHLAELVDQLSAGIAAQLADRLQADRFGLDGGDARLLTVAQTAKRLSLSRSTVYELIRRDELASIRVGGARRITSEALAEFKSSLTTDPRRPSRPPSPLSQPRRRLPGGPDGARGG